MRRATLIVAIAVAGSACGGGDPTTDPMPDARVAPTGFTFEAVGDRSFVSFGWTGLIHDVATPDGMPFGVRTTNCTGPDGACTFDGPDEPVNPVPRKRCLNRMSKTCKADADCQGDATGPCVFIYDVPTAIPQPGPMNGTSFTVGGCAFSYIAPTPRFSGTFDLGSGELNIKDLTVNIVQNGIALNTQVGTYRGTCMECVGDPTPNDGKKDGTCRKVTHAGQNIDPSLDEGMACDVNRYGNLRGFTGSYSMDCSPTVRATDPVNPFTGTFTSSGYQIMITADSPDCTDPDFPGEKCFCGMCPDGMTSCTSSRECGGAKCGALPANCDRNPMPFTDAGSFNMQFNPMFAPMQCRTTGVSGSATRPNSCRNGVCNWNANTGTGTCMSTLTNSLVGCYPRAAPMTPTGIGAQVVAPGGVNKLGSVWVVDTGFARCTAAQGPALNGQLGLPGLTFQKRSFRVIPEYR